MEGEFIHYKRLLETQIYRFSVSANCINLIWILIKVFKMAQKHLLDDVGTLLTSYLMILRSYCYFLGVKMVL